MRLSHKAKTIREQTTLDIIPGFDFDSVQCDDDGDCTEYALKCT